VVVDLYLGAAELARRIAAGKVSSRELVEACLQRIRRFNPQINAMVVLRAEEALARAEEADRVQSRGVSWGPLHGVPISVKECFDWVGTPSTFGHPERRDHKAAENAVALARLIAAGAIVLGKTNVPKDLSDWQSFNALYGMTRTPWNLEYSPGGSSGGAAAALAAGFSALEIGSDVGGSIRVPSHFCGVYGHRPTFGLVPVRGHAMAPDLPPDDVNAVGPLARTGEDLELGLRLMAGVELASPRVASPREWRVAVLTGDAEFPVDLDTRHAALAVAGVLREAGAKVTLDPALPMASRGYYELYIALLRGSTSFRRPLAEIAALAPAAAALDPADRGYEALMLRGLTQTHREWLERNAERYRLRAGWERFFRDYDALIAPVAPTQAFPHIVDTPKAEQRLSVDGRVRPMADTYFWIGIAATAYLPSTTIPAGRSKHGLPIGLQIIGPEHADLSCIALARYLEKAHRGFEPPLVL
jgi:amidase